MIDRLKRLFTGWFGRGRITRLDSWLGTILLQVVDSAADHLFDIDRFDSEQSLWALSVLTSFVAMHWLTRRFHDAGLSGAWLLMPIGAIFGLWFWQNFGEGYPFAPGPGQGTFLFFDTTPLGWPALLITLATVIVLLLPPSKSADRFGPDPRARIEPSDNRGAREIGTGGQLK